MNGLQRLFSSLEPVLVGFLILYFLGLDLPPAMISALNSGSYGLLALLILPRWKQCLYGATRDVSILLLHGVTIASVIWSAAPEITSNETKAVVRAALFGVYLATRFTLKEQMQLLARTLSIAVVLSLIAGAAIPSYGTHLTGEFVGSWKGIFLFKNLFAYVVTLAAILFLLMALQIPRRRWLSWLMLGFSIVLLIFSRGKTALVVSVVSICLIPLQQFVRQQYRSKVILIATSLLVAGSAIVLALVNLEYVVVDLLGKNLEFNGRMPIWLLMLEKASEHPWLGYGYGGFWTSDAADYILTRTWAQEAHEAGLRFNAHNGYLELFLQLGWLGFSLYLVSLVTVLAKTLLLLFKTKNLEVFWVLQTLVAMILFNFADSLGVLSVGAQWSLYISFVTSIAILYQRAKRDRQYQPEFNQPQLIG